MLNIDFQPKGFSLINSIKFTAKFVLACLFLFETSCEKYKLDQEMNQMCKNDGGYKVYETIKLPSQMFDKSGHIKAFIDSKSGNTVAIIAMDYMEIEKITVLKEGDPLKGEGRLTRVYRNISRTKDGTILAEAVQYRRAGGDGLYFGHHTQKTCPDGQIDLRGKVFVQQSGGDR